MKNKGTRKNSKAFTLVELMVVVAIIGVLASIAIPNYRRYQGRARQSEAKLGLSAIYTAEQSFSAEWGSFSGCLKRMGAELGTVEKRYFAVGFSESTVGTNAFCGPTGLSICRAYTWSGTTAQALCPATNNEVFFMGTAKSSPSFDWIPLNGQASWPAGDISQNTFEANSIGSVSSDTVTDSWVINHNKTLVNYSPGI